MPKEIKDFGITMKEAEEAKMSDPAYPPKESSEMKAEPQDESDIICHYFTRENDCPGPMGDERSYVIKNDKLVMAHKRCQKRASGGEKKTPTVMIR